MLSPRIPTRGLRAQAIWRELSMPSSNVRSVQPRLMAPVKVRDGAWLMERPDRRKSLRLLRLYPSNHAEISLMLRQYRTHLMLQPEHSTRGSCFFA